MKYLVFFLTILTIFVSIFFFDKDIAIFFEKNRDLRDFFEIVTFFGRAELYLIPSLLVYLIYRKKETIKRYAFFVFSSVALSGIAVNILKIIFARYRPKMLFSENLYGFSWFDIGYNLASFPSGHTTIAFAAMVSLSFVWSKFRYIFLSIAALIGFSRIVLGAHYLSDVLAGALLGSITSYIIYKKLFRNNHG